MPAKVITEILDKYATAPKSNMQALEDHELSIVFEHLTQNNQISNIAAIYADEPKKPESPKVEAPKAEAPKAQSAAAQQTAKPAQQPQQRHIQERDVKVKGGEVRDDGRGRRDVEHDLHDELVVVRPEEVQLFQRVSQRDDEDVGRSLEQYLSHARSPSVLYFLQVTV